ncbi:MaoC/PaaZ C-terminal domain-containing protein [Pseudonocardia kunmingensis]|nr:MaoC/PaaZ C-terminal domain-containing protein [Pseudonocardia kunmingensis]
MYYEDFTLGQAFTMPTRTITETDLVSFSELSGDHNALHTDEEFAKTTAYGQRVVHGLLGVSVITGLLDRIGIFEGTAVALLGIDGWRFRAPIFVGDTVTSRMVIEGKRPTRHPERGLVERWFELDNQHGERLQEGHMPGLVLRRNPGGEG